MKTLNLVTLSLIAASTLGLNTQTQAAPLVQLEPLRTIVPIVIDPIVLNQWALTMKDIKLHHGSFCEAYTGTQEGDLNHQDNGLRNISAASRTVVCPILRDNADKTINFAVDIFVNNIAGSNFSCWVDSRDQWGNLVKWVNKATNLGGNQTIHIENDSNVKDGNFNLYCSVPASGRIASYKTYEASTLAAPSDQNR